MFAKRNVTYAEMEARGARSSSKSTQTSTSVLETSSLANGGHFRCAQNGMMHMRRSRLEAACKLKVNSVFYNYLGAGNVVVGQWWPFQTCTKRNGAHVGHVQAQSRISLR